jgi:hypothetical protein
MRSHELINTNPYTAQMTFAFPENWLSSEEIHAIFPPFLSSTGK